MKIKWLAMVGALTAMAVTTTQAMMITPGSGISLAGTYVTDTGDLNTANAFTSFSGVYVASDSGAFATAGVTLLTPGSVSMTAFSFDPFPGTGVTPLWTTTSGVSASFDLAPPISVSQPGNDSLTLTGTGTLHLAGYDPTPGSWIFTANQGGSSFSFSSSNTALPDGGTTVMLLGAALTGLGLIRRKFLA